MSDDSDKKKGWYAMQNIVSQMSRGQGHEFLNKLEAAGLSSELAQKVVDAKNNELGQKVVKLIEDYGFNPESQKRAREIMGNNFFGVKEAMKYFGIVPTSKQLKYYSEIPISEEILKHFKDEYLLVADFGLSIVEINKKTERAPYYISRDDMDELERRKLKFIRDCEKASWQLICKKPVDFSSSRDFNRQKVLLESNEVIPSARTLVYAVIGHKLAVDELLFSNFFVRTSTVYGPDQHVRIGSFGEGVAIVGYHDIDANNVVELASAKIIRD